jgi:hypothetical protein
MLKPFFAYLRARAFEEHKKHVQVLTRLFSLAGDYRWQVCHLPLVSTTPVLLVLLIPVANLISVSTTRAANFATSTAGVVDTGIKDTGGKY